MNEILPIINPDFIDEWHKLVWDAKPKCVLCGDALDQTNYAIRPFNPDENYLKRLWRQIKQIRHQGYWLPVCDRCALFYQSQRSKAPVHVNCRCFLELENMETEEIPIPESIFKRKYDIGARDKKFYPLFIPRFAWMLSPDLKKYSPLYLHRYLTHKRHQDGY